MRRSRFWGSMARSEVVFLKNRLRIIAPLPPLSPTPAASFSLHTRRASCPATPATGGSPSSSRGARCGLSDAHLQLRQALADLLDPHVPAQDSQRLRHRLVEGFGGHLYRVLGAGEVATRRRRSARGRPKAVFLLLACCTQEEDAGSALMNGSTGRQAGDPARLAAQLSKGIAKGAMADLPNSGTPRRPLKWISDDQDRRAQAKKDLELAPQSYTKAVPRERELDLSSLSEIWCQYAGAIYDSLAQSYHGLPGNPQRSSEKAAYWPEGRRVLRWRRISNESGLPVPNTGRILRSTATAILRRSGGRCGAFWSARMWVLLIFWMSPGSWAKSQIA